MIAYKHIQTTLDQQQPNETPKQEKKSCIKTVIENHRSARNLNKHLKKSKGKFTGTTYRTHYL